MDRLYQSQQLAADVVPEAPADSVDRVAAAIGVQVDVAGVAAVVADGVPVGPVALPRAATDNSQRPSLLTPLIQLKAYG